MHSPFFYSSFLLLLFCRVHGEVTAESHMTAPSPPARYQVQYPRATTAASQTTASASLTLTVHPIGFVTSNTYCSLVSYFLRFCNSATPGFSTLNYTSQTPCLCYSGTSWAPQFFDNYVTSCAQYVSSVEPLEYPKLTSLEGFCSASGGPSSSSSRTLLASTTATTASEQTTVSTGSGSTPSSNPPSPGLPGIQSISSI
jgi:hypothetical protein